MAAITQSRPASPNGIRTPLFILGVALAMLAFLVMFAFGIVYVGRSQTSGQSTVLVSTRDIDAREPITPDMVKVDKWPSSAVVRGTYTTVAAVNGLAAVVAIPKGQPISPNLVGNPDGLVGAAQSSYLPIPDGYVAMTMPTGEQQGVAGYIAQGDYIDVIATVNTSQFSRDNPRSVAKTVFNNLHVIRVGPQSVVPRQGQAQGLSSSITVVMTLCDAQYMDWLLSNATLKYTLLAYTNYSKATPTPDPGCPSTSSPAMIGPAQVDARWGFSKGG
jgi:Flp pilus assembly protein CpaB